MADIDAIRAKRLAELADQQKSSSGAGNDAGQPSAEEAQAMREQEEEAQRGMLSQILEPAARERLNRIRLVRPQRAQGVQQMLLRMAQSGQLRGRVSEPQLVDLLDQVEAAEAGGRPGAGSTDKSKIIFSRRKGNDSDDDDMDFPRARTTTANGARGRKTAHDSDDDFDL